MTNLSGGPVNTTGPNQEVAIPLNGAPSFAMTQKAGEALQVIATVDFTHPEGMGFCGLTVLVVDRDDRLVARVDLRTNKGEFGDGSGIGGLAAPAANRSITLEAFARENEECDGADGADTWTVSVDVSVIGLSN